MSGRFSRWTSKTLVLGVTVFWLVWAAVTVLFLLGVVVFFGERLLSGDVGAWILLLFLISTSVAAVAIARSVETSVEKKRAQRLSAIKTLGYLTPERVHNMAFAKPRMRDRGYNKNQVDAFVDLVETALRDPTGRTFALSPEQVRNKAFGYPSRGKRGYHRDDVDMFVDLVETKLRHPTASTLTPEDARDVAFSEPPRGKLGYNEDEVDAFLDLVEVALRDPRGRTLTPEDVRNVVFAEPPRGERGYDKDEVDAFLDLVEVEVKRRATRMDT